MNQAATSQKMIRNILSAGAKGKTFIGQTGSKTSKKENDLIDYNLSCCPIWESLIGYLWLVFLKFWFINLEAFIRIETSLGFGLLTYAAKS